MLNKMSSLKDKIKAQGEIGAAIDIAAGEKVKPKAKTLKVGKVGKINKLKK
jgi:hypothetical protein